MVDQVAGTQIHADRVVGAKLLLNHLTPGDGSEFRPYSPVRAEWDEEMVVVFSTSVPNRVRVAIPL